MISSRVGNGVRYDHRGHFLLPSTVPIGESLERRFPMFCGKLVGPATFSLNVWGHHASILGYQLVTTGEVSSLVTALHWLSCSQPKSNPAQLKRPK